MCGIAGIISKGQRYPLLDDGMLRLQSAIYHRGPDGAGLHADGARAFLNMRLAIVDVAGGNQPMWSADHKVGIVYNGEVYNYRELRAELIARGSSFHTDSDTEVVLRMYEAYGTAGFARLSGMFGCCIWDDRTGDIFLVRDHLGIKPLYLYEDGDKFVFSSEIKGILSLPEIDCTLNPAGFQDYLTFRYIQAPLTMFRRIERLDAGTYVRIRGGLATHHRYWEVEYTPSTSPLDTAALSEQLSELLKRAVSSQLMGEVPIGVLLSGGLDSSTISYFVHELGANLTTFNIGFPELNEFPFSRAVAHKFGLNHVEVEMSVDELAQSVDSVVLALDEPIADPACFPLYRICGELKRHVTVVLSGEGADEIFAGYPQYNLLMNWQGEPWDAYQEFLNRSWYFRDALQFLNDPSIPPHELRHRKYFAGSTRLNNMLGYDIKTWLPENLMMKADKILMAHSLEGRFPFLDKDLFEFAAKLPTHLKLSSDGVGKWLLKNLMAPRLPEEVTNRPKMGFSVPVDALLKKLRGTVESSIESASLYDEVLDTKKLTNLTNNYYQRGEGSALQVWTVFVMAHWFNTAFRTYRKAGSARHVVSSDQGFLAGARQ